MLSSEFQDWKLILVVIGIALIEVVFTVPLTVLMIYMDDIAYI